MRAKVIKPIIQNRTLAGEWVDDSNRLSELCDQWQQQPRIALDTEFIRNRTFFPIIGLLQIADAHGIYLIDPLAEADTQPLKRILQNTQVTKVIHACSEDLEVFARYLGVLPRPLFDTQVAAAFCGYGTSIGYANLLKAIFNITIPKQETRSDWLQRPLSQAQLNYATLDVADLLAVYEQQVSQLTHSQRLSWVLSDCQKFLDTCDPADTGSDYYLRIKSAWKCQPNQLAVLKLMCSWREQQVRQLDIPRNHLVKDVSIWDMAQKLPENLLQLKTIKEIHPGFIKKYGKQCLITIKQAIADSENYPERIPPPPAREQAGLLNQLKGKVASVAEELQLPPELLACNRDLKTLVRLSQSSAPIELPEALKGWRREIIGQPLLKFLFP